MDEKDQENEQLTCFFCSGAHMLGGVDTCAEANQSRWDLGFHIADSTITNMPVEYTGATAVLFGYVGNSTLEHSLIANTSYSAMTIGWGWGHGLWPWQQPHHGQSDHQLEHGPLLRRGAGVHAGPAARQHHRAQSPVQLPRWASRCWL